ncbi:MAG: type II toxin-antitoxin system RelE/ParE family toxin [Solirubrobacteraceae bacterium]
MARVELSVAAIEDLDALIRTHSLPDGTTMRVRESLRALERFPRLGPELHGRWEGLRFLIGPWRWLLLVYAFFPAEDRVVVVTIQDARSSSAPLSPSRLA